MKTFIKNNGFYFLGIIILLLIWEIVSLFYKEDIVFPALGQIGTGLKEIIVNPKTYKVLGATILRLLISLGVSVALSILFASLARKFGWFKQIVTPLIGVFKSTPVASFIIIILVIVGHERSSMVISLLIMFPIMYEGFYNAFNCVNKEIRDEIKTISKFNFEIAKSIYVPLAMPFIITTLLQSISLGLKSLVMAELLTTPKYSIGSELLSLKTNFEMNKIMAWTLILVLISIAFEIILNNVKKKAESIY